ncbi:MAG TPA: hypothetical protein VM326_03275 [Sphingomicrobium sp.]|jgi:hypothetical protein|nr:hypothetical protein [Sphingomicrobium sp.]
MKRLGFGFLAFAALSTGAPAAPSCTNWMLQSDGSYWRTCVDDQGRQYCERMYNNYITRVACS